MFTVTCLSSSGLHCIIFKMVLWKVVRQWQVYWKLRTALSRRWITDGKLMQFISISVRLLTHAVSASCLFKKPHSIGIRGSLLRWLHSYYPESRASFISSWDEERKGDSAEIVYFLWRCRRPSVGDGTNQFCSCPTGFAARLCLNARAVTNTWAHIIRHMPMHLIVKTRSTDSSTLE